MPREALVVVGIRKADDSVRPGLQLFIDEWSRPAIDSVPSLDGRCHALPCALPIESAALAKTPIEDYFDVAVVLELLGQKLIQIAMRPADDVDMACHDPPEKRASARHGTFPLQILNTAAIAKVRNKFSAIASCNSNMGVMELMEERV